ncbi:MAG: universal stress protein [Planctomycetales bacterium]|nr:universal stress protein [Planctomycetales bacterium]
MKRFKNILVATDTQLDAHPIVDEAGEIAQHNGASVKIVDVVPEFPWTVRLAMKDHEHVRDLMGREKQERLEALAAPIRDKGISVETRVLQGKTSVEIIREVLRHKHDLVFRVAKGKDSRRSGFFGTTGVRLLRECPCAVWLVAPAPTPQYKHVLGCVDPSSDDELNAELNGKVYELSSLISQYHDAQLSIVHAWSIFGEQLLKNRMNPEEYEEINKNNQKQIESLLDKFLQTRGSSVRDENVHMLKGEAHNIIPDFVSKNGVDLVVMGTVARSGATGMIIGNTAERILNSIECSVLAFKPSTFVSPITLGDYINPTQESSRS